jgi:hypothetical protein
MTDSLIRPCHGCLVFDDHPRHEIIDINGGDAHGGPMHMDCCAALRNCDLCREVLARAYGHAGKPVIGDVLRASLVALPPLQVNHAEGDPFNVLEVTETEVA